MICQRCKCPMHLARREGGTSVFKCEYCRKQITRREAEKTGYSGTIAMGSWAPGARGVK